VTNTLHRQGAVESLRGDYVIFCSVVPGVNQKGSGPKKRRFAELCLKHDPVNFGIHEFERGETTVLSEYLRERSAAEYYDDSGRPTERLRGKWQSLLDRIDDDSGPNAVFDDIDRLGALIAELRKAQLGISINISGLHSEVDSMLRDNGIVRHTIEHSLGFHGKTEQLPAPEIVEIATMCGHGMVSYNLVKRMLELVKAGRLTPARAAEHLAKPCTCSVFNTARAAELLEQARDHV
jgi:hypothetical protein